MPDDPLTEETLAFAVPELARRDADLARVVALRGVPPLWAREPGFATLALIILEQQVSLASARAAFDRLAAAGPVEPLEFLRHGDEALLRFGFSRQKAGYVRSLASAIVDGHLELDALTAADDPDVLDGLTAQHGIGPWSASIYLLMALRRPDVWPSGDLALAEAVRIVKRLDHRPTRDELEAIGEWWRPWRAVAARLLWSDYLARRTASRSAAAAA